MGKHETRLEIQEYFKNLKSVPEEEVIDEIINEDHVEVEDVTEEIVEDNNEL